MINAIPLAPQLSRALPAGTHHIEPILVLSLTTLRLHHN